MLKKYLRGLICPSPRPLEFILAIQAILFGAWLLLPYETFGVSSTYAVMRSIAPEWLWGAVIFGVGAIQFFGLFTKRIGIRRVLGFLDLFLWTAVDLAQWLTHTESAAPIIYFTAVVAAVLVNLSLVVNGCDDE